MGLSRYSNKNLLDMPNCIGLMENGSCSVLNIWQCQGDKCSFKVTKEDADVNDLLVKKRLLQLDEETQEKIARKYYGGKRLWQE